MVSWKNVRMLIAAATRRIGLELGSPEMAALEMTVMEMCRLTNDRFDADRAVAVIATYEFDPASLASAKNGDDVLGMSIRHKECDLWRGKFRFLSTGMRRLVTRARELGATTVAHRNAATVYALIGYAIRVGNAD
jgi:hypothetical protein